MRRLPWLAQSDVSECTWHIQLGVLVISVGRQMLADGNSLLDEHVEVLRDLGSKA